MKIFTYSQARQNFSSVLDFAKSEGCVMIKRKDGSMFKLLLSAFNKKDSPLNVVSIKTSISTKDILDSIRESR